MLARMERVKCAVIGAGWWGTTSHVPALRDNPHADLVAIQHQDRETAERIARDFGVPHACTTAEEVLAIDGLQAVAISSVPKLHYEQGKAALDRGLHVLIEKPFTIRGEEGRELVSLADAKGLHLMVGATYHFTRHCQEARRVLRSGDIGTVRMISILFTNLTQGLYRGLEWDQAMPSEDEARSEHQRPYLVPGQTSYSDPAIAGGGQIYTQVSHPAAYVSYLTERQPVEVFARFENDGAAVDVYDALVIVLDDGTLVSLASNGAATAAKMHYELRVHGTALWKGTAWTAQTDWSRSSGRGRSNRGRRRRYPRLTEHEPLEDTYPRSARATLREPDRRGRAAPRRTCRPAATARSAPWSARRRSSPSAPAGRWPCSTEPERSVEPPVSARPGRSGR